MKIELIRTEEIDGNIWYRLMVNNNCQQSFYGEERKDDAIKTFALYKSRAKDFPKKEVVLTWGE